MLLSNKKLLLFFFLDFFLTISSSLLGKSILLEYLFSLFFQWFERFSFPILNILFSFKFICVIIVFFLLIFLIFAFESLFLLNLFSWTSLFFFSNSIFFMKEDSKDFTLDSAPFNFFSFSSKSFLFDLGLNFTKLLILKSLYSFSDELEDSSSYLLSLIFKYWNFLSIYKLSKLFIFFHFLIFFLSQNKPIEVLEN